MSLFDSQAMEDVTNVVTRPPLRIVLLAVGNVRGRVTPGVEGEASVAAREIADLRLVATVIAAKFMNKYDRESFASFFVIEFDASSAVR
jgi:hypothetical protein